MGWLELGNDPEAKQIIHPSGVDIEQYNKSGLGNAKTIQDFIPKPFKVMEYGCGTGRILRHIKDCEKVGVDIVPEFIEECKSEGIDAHLIKDYNFNGDCDIIFAITVFIHLSKKDAMIALENIYKGLKVGGLALLQMPIYDKDKEPNEWFDVGVWSEKSLREACDKVGFEVDTLYMNPGEFDFITNIGEHHDSTHILRKRK